MKQPFTLLAMAWRSTSKQWGDILQSNQSRWKLVHTLSNAPWRGLNKIITKIISTGLERSSSLPVCFNRPNSSKRAAAHKGLIWDQIFWNFSGNSIDRAFLFSELFSLVNFIVTVGHFGIPNNPIFQLLVSLALPPYGKRSQKMLSKFTYGIHLKSKSKI